MDSSMLMNSLMATMEGDESRQSSTCYLRSFPNLLPSDQASHQSTTPTSKSSSMVAAAKVTRSGINVFKLWLTDKGTFPIVLIASSAAVGAATMGFRYMFLNPDVYFDKERRERVIHHEEEPGAAWRQFRFRMANLKRNPINQSRQFDTLFDKPENQSVRR